MSNAFQEYRVSMSAPDVSEADIEAVVGVLRSGRLALGPKCTEFEQKLAEYVGVEHAVAVSSGTAALHLLVRILGLGAGDEVLVPSFTFAASVNAILYERATPVFVDVQPDTYNLDPEDLERKITASTKAIMAVDVFGHPVEWDEIQQIASDKGLMVIDDCCEALGAEYRGVRVGSFGTAGAFAFYPNKQMTTGEGGVIVTSDQLIADQARSLRNQGRDDGMWLRHARLGFNYRMDEMSAALGSSQLDRLDSFLAKRNRVAAAYSDRLTGIQGIRLPTTRTYVHPSWFVYVVTLDERLDPLAVSDGLERRRIPCRDYFPPMHAQPYIHAAGTDGTLDLPETHRIAGRTMALPFHNNLSDDDVELVARALEESIEDAVRGGS